MDASTGNQRLEKDLPKKMTTKNLIALARKKGLTIEDDYDAVYIKKAGKIISIVCLESPRLSRKYAAIRIAEYGNIKNNNRRK